QVCRGAVCSEQSCDQVLSARKHCAAESCARFVRNHSALACTFGKNIHRDYLLGFQLPTTDCESEGIDGEFEACRSRFLETKRGLTPTVNPRIQDRYC